jgi:hypothetical protein
MNRVQKTAYRQALEMLEVRTLFSLLGVAPGFPQIETDQTGTLTYSYNSGTSIGSFDVSSTAFSYAHDASSPQLFIFGNSTIPASFQIHFKTDASGNVNGHNLVGDDFTVSGTIDMNNDFQPDAGDLGGTLLTGTITQFGSLDNGGTTDQFDFRFTITGGLLPTTFPADYAGKDIGVTMTSENSSFTGDFTQGFSGDVKATEGPIPGGGTLPPGIQS